MTHNHHPDTRSIPLDALAAPGARLLATTAQSWGLHWPPRRGVTAPVQKARRVSALQAVLAQRVVAPVLPQATVKGLLFQFAA